MDVCHARYDKGVPTLQFMRTWELYLDESYNSHLFCVGGFLAPAQCWTREIVPRWSDRIDYENRQSAKKGFPAISRYHATDCANLRKEFAKEKGWDENRQVLLSKRLCKIISGAKPCGIVVGGRIEDMKNYLPEAASIALESLYDVCFRMALIHAFEMLRRADPSAELRVIYEDSPRFGAVARGSLESVRSAESYLQEFFTDDGGPENPRSCVPLQPADFLAYEGMKRLDGVRRGSEQVRKALGSLIGGNLPLLVCQFTDDNFIAIKKMRENVSKGKPVEEGIESELLVGAISGIRSL